MEARQYKPMERKEKLYAVSDSELARIEIKAITDFAIRHMDMKKSDISMILAKEYYTSVLNIYKILDN